MIACREGPQGSFSRVKPAMRGMPVFNAPAARHRRNTTVVIMTVVFYLVGLMLLLVMAYVLWSGVGRRRPAIARAFALVVLAVAAWIVWQLFEVLF